VLSERPERFDCREITFTRKKDAKQYASKKAIDWLIEMKYMPSDGSATFPKVPKPSPMPSGSKPSPDVRSYASQVPELCHRLRINLPSYRIEKISAGGSIYRAHADFGNDPRESSIFDIPLSLLAVNVSVVARS